MPAPSMIAALALRQEGASSVDLGGFEPVHVFATVGRYHRRPDAPRKIDMHFKSLDITTAGLTTTHA